MKFKIIELIRRILPAVIVLTLSACSANVQTPQSAPENEKSENSLKTTYLSADSMFSDRDRDPSFDGGCEILLSDDKIESSCDSLMISGSTVTIKEEGIYIISGALSNGQIIVDAQKTDKVQLVLDGADINNSSSAPIYVRCADKVFITLKDGSESSLKVTGEYTAIDENNIDAAIFSKEDITLNGSGMLNISADYGHGIVSKDELAVCGGNISVTAQKHALAGKDCVKISGGTLNLKADKDGIHAENADNVASGFIYIGGGNINIESSGDGMDAAYVLQTDGGSIEIKSGDTATNFKSKSDDFFSSFRPVDSSEDTVSTKGIKCDGSIVINDGSFKLNCADDAVHSNGNIEINGGSFEISTGDDGIHADNSVIINDGDINISESYEGIEGLTIDINGSNITLHSSDDGINAAGGNDGSGFRGAVTQSDTEEEVYIKINGGVLRIFADGDGIDSNGSLYVSGGETYVEGPENSGNGALDYDKSAQITGGTFIALGASGMAQGFGDSSTQGAILINLSSQMQSDEISLSDADGNIILSYTPSKSYNSAVISCKEICKGNTYIINAGENTQTVEMTETVYGQSGSGFHGGGKTHGGGKSDGMREFPNGGNNSSPGGSHGKNRTKKIRRSAATYLFCSKLQAL